jgi:PKD domain-containing protein
MPSFILRNLDPIFWARVQAKAAAEGTTVKALILRLLTVWLAALVLVALSAGCAYKNPTGPSPAIVVPSASPASLQFQASTQADHTIALAVKALTIDGRFVSGVTVAFTTSTGSLSQDTAVTDATGLAHTVLSSSETATVEASAGSLTVSTTLLSSVPVALVGAPPVYPPTVPSPNIPPSTPPPPPAPLPAPPAPAPPAPPALAVTLTCTPAAPGALTMCNLAATFGTVPIPSTAITRVDYDFGDGQSQTVTGSPLIAHTFTQVGTYLIVASVDAVTPAGPKGAVTSTAVIVK